MSTRREFLVGCSSAIAAMAGARFGSLAFADTNVPSSDHILVVIFFRGGMDGLNLVAPVDDADYIAARTADTMIAATGKNAGLALANGYPGHDFRLHYGAGGLKELYDSKDLALIHASGLANGTRSHFEAQDLVDLGVSDMNKLHYGTGWLDRLIQASNGNHGTVPIVSMSGSVPRSLLGSIEAVSMPNPANFAFYGSPDQKKALASLYAGSGLLAEAGTKTLETLDLIQAKMPHDAKGRALPYATAPGIKYANGGLSGTFESLARLIKMDVGLQFATIDYGGWDTHQNQGPQFNRQASELSRSLLTFWNDLQAYRSRITVVAVSEFGRRVKANQSNGTDHGHGNVMLVLGGNVHGGQMHGRWPGLGTDQLDQRADLAVTTDYRNVLAELALKRYGLKDAKSLFPGLVKQVDVGVFA